EDGREAQIGMGRPRETIDAAMLATAIGVDRQVEGNVGRVVAGDDPAGGIDGHGCLEGRQILECPPPVVEARARQRLKAAGGIRLGTTSAAAFGLDRYLDIDWRIQVDGGRSGGLVRRLRLWSTPGKAAGRRGRLRCRRASGGCGGASHGRHLIAGLRTKQEHNRRLSSRKASENRYCGPPAFPEATCSAW